MAENNKSHQQGMIDGIELWGTVCGKQGNCEGCPIGSIRGTNVTCQDFARQFPAKMLSILKEMNDGQLTYYEEYCMRFPECNLDLEVLAAGTCRKMIFEGYCGCDKADDPAACEACWREQYIGDITEVAEEDATTAIVE